MASNSLNNNLINPRTVWKATLEAYPTRSLLSLKSLWELIYNNNGIPWIRALTTGENLDSNGKACKLDHDIICYSQALYQKVGVIDQISYKGDNLDPERAYELLGIDISIPLYDSRSKIREREIKSNDAVTLQALSLNNLIVANPRTIFNSGVGLCHDKNSALEPLNIDSFVKRGVQVSDDFTEQITVNTKYIADSKYTAPHVITLDNVGSSDNITAPICLCHVDTAFRGTLTTETDLNAYNYILLNPYNNNWVACLVLRALQEQLTYNKTGDGILIQKIFWDTVLNQSDITTNLVDLVFNTLPTLIDGKETIGGVSPNGTWADILKHTFVWVKAPFFGDYIQPEVFNQDLSSDSDVIHNNIVISDTADFNKYDKYSEVGDHSSEDIYSYPYIPITSPGLDLVTPKIYKSITGSSSNDTTNLEDAAIKKIIEEGDKNENSKIGSIKFAPNLRSNETNALPNYFDPEVDYSIDSLRHLPTIIPSSGNLYTDGRIISPTIDELWVYLKKLTEGRRKDSLTVLDPEELDMGRAISTEENKKLINDTILTAPISSEMSFNVDGKERYGDIINVAYTTDDRKNMENTIKVTDFINNNNSIKYNIFSALKRISKSITAFDLSKSSTGSKEREITNFTAWCYTNKDEKDEEYYSTLKDGDTASVNENDNIWRPRKNAPYSLRELEAITKGNKYNIITLARFIENNFSVVGPLGYKYYEEGENSDSIGDETTPEQAAGSLYQFHRDYNYKVNNPNTFFRMDGEGKNLFNEDGTKNIKTSGCDASFNDLSAADAEPENELLLYNSNSPKTSKMPLLVKNYGKSIYLKDEFGSYAGSDIYMAADGTWRYTAEHSRVPILRSRY